MSLTSTQIFAIIEEIAGTASKNEKIAKLKNACADAQFVRVLEYAYNPFKRFYMRKRPELVGGPGVPPGSNEFDADTWQLLDDIIDRQVTGNNAIEFVRGEMSALNAESAELLWRIIKKDLRAGFSEESCNKAVKGLIPDPPYMRCSLPKHVKLNEWPWGQGVVSQEKADGMFTNADISKDGEVSLSSRQGTPIPMDQFERLATELSARLTHGCQHHGELLVRKAGKVLDREIGNGILNHVISGGAFAEDEEPIYLVWDQIPLESAVNKGKFESPYIKRLSGLISQLKAGKGNLATVQLISTRIVHSLEDAYGHYRELVLQGKEGTVIKTPTGYWKDTTSKDQVKLKLEFNCDLKVLEILPGKEGTKTEGRAGSLRCSTSDGLLVVDVTVKNEDMRNRVDANPEDWIGRVIEVTANDILEPSESNSLHSLFLPRMVVANYRTDKVEADTLQRVKDQMEAAKLGKTIAEIEAA